MNLFLDDYDTGMAEGRYQYQQLPTLSFADQSFDLALVSHLLDLYSAHLSEDIHLQSIRELLRVAREVRIFPLLTLTGELSPYVAKVEKQFTDWGYESERLMVPYEFQKGSNQMLRIK
ncbi:class I SAM-dependent methyltransferase [Fibrisoma montanum]|uniref:class I SAM-dependent methyltransferase n=1 Tax=Fibrisoma montanum TaxID=2305895 RepID=UPI0018F39617|nr:class I SAM-dependent methyltransferase [Fibrisoma montanum]